MRAPLDVLMVEVGDPDSLLIARALRPYLGSANFERAETLSLFLQALKKKPWDAILVDCDVPGFDALWALQLVREVGLDVPVIIVSWGIGEGAAVAAIKAGASDYVLKSDLSRLAPVLEREFKEAALRRERRLAEAQLRANELSLRTLLGSTTDLIFTLDQEQRHTSAFGGPRRAGPRSPAALLGRTSRELVGEQAARVHEQANARALRGESLVYEWSELRDGAVRTFQTALSPLASLTGETAVVGVTRELTGLRELRPHRDDPLEAIFAGVEQILGASSGAQPLDPRSELASHLRDVRVATDRIRALVAEMERAALSEEDRRRSTATAQETHP